ncbi:MAG: sodium-translocating pyrophosphatase [Kiritimatiellales bacterium]|nr:sodium-translocating pyrophosphatase [Kiritimatiellales bacterium]
MDTFGWTLLIVAGGSFLALGYAAVKTKWIFSQPVENPKLIKIGGFVADGAMAFLTREYKVLIPFVLFVAAFLAIANQGALRYQSVAFVVGAMASALAGFIGMKVATAANTRTTHAAQGGLIPALKVAFSGGSVMGMSVVGLSMLGFFILLFLGRLFFGSSVGILASEVLPIVTGFSLGASSMALFARVGGGIFTKAADVGADLVGKVEAGIPEDDHRNPATIADNVGDNVGDVAGMGADLFESYVGSIIGAMVLGVSIAGSDAYRLKLVVFPLLLAVTGIVAAMIGVGMVRVKEGQSPQAALNKGTFGAAGIAAMFSFLLCLFFLGRNTGDGEMSWLNVFFSSVLGMVAGTLIGMITEYYTGTDTRPVNKIVKSCETGAATTLITGMGVGMASAFPPILIIVAAILSSQALAGLYGIAIAALGMLMTLGVQLAVDAYGPIADNAGGLAEMSEFPPEVRGITDKLDAVGNTTAAIGKGFAIGSAALTAIILFSAFRQQVGVGAIDLVDPKVVSGVLLGAVLPYLFSSMAMNAVGEAAFAMIKEVRRQFREKPGILKETDLPDYKKCVDISTAAALKGMVIPGVVAVVTPVLVGFVGGPSMLAGTLIGVTASGVVLAIFMSNAGGAWDNAKKMIEGGASQGKGSEAHKAAVVGDTVGDPFKDTAGPSLNILIKLMAIISLVIAPMLKKFWGL